MAKFKSRGNKRDINEIMTSLLCPLMNHCDNITIHAIEITLRILQETEVEDRNDNRCKEDITGNA